MSTTNTDLFGREIFHPIHGQQMPLFHEPIRIIPPQVERIGSRNANDPRHTKPLFLANTKPLDLSGAKAS